MSPGLPSAPEPERPIVRFTASMYALQETLGGRYALVCELGKGGMGVVYKAQDLKLDRLVALKFLPASLAATEDEVARFQQEAKAISALNHPNIATIYDVDQANGQRFLVLEYLSGGTLKSQIKNLQSSGRELSVSQVVEYSLQIAEGLAHAHRHGIVHRDVKTDNMMLTDEGKVKITDFGLAKLQGGVHLTKTGTTVGTAAYMSPEQVIGEGVDHRSDLFSFGVVLYELATVRLPFRGEHEAALSYSIVNESPVPMKSLRSDVPDGLERVITRLLEKEKEKRYQSAEDLVTDLRKLHQETSGRIVVAEKRTRLPWVIAAAAVVLAAVAIFLFFPIETTTVDRKSIAVLPFKNLSEEKENEFFSDGITEDIITQVSKIGDLKVISRTSVMRYKNTDKPLRDIGKELDVATVLEGSVRRAGNQVRIVAQLIDAGSDEHLWAETYDRELTQIFAIQSEIAQQIAAALKAHLSPSEKQLIEKAGTENIDAYTFYLKGREYYYTYRKQDNENAIELFKKALQLDPTYALAYAGLGDTYAQRPWRFGFSSDWLDSAIAMSNKAISLDPKLAEGYKALGLVCEYQGRFRKALEANQKAIGLNPNYHPAVANIGWVNWFLGEYAEALKWLKKSELLNPGSAQNYYGIGIVHTALDDEAKAIDWYQKALDIQPDFIYALQWRGHHFVLNKRPDEALNYAKKILSLDPNELAGHYLALDAHLLSGNLEEARRHCEKALSIDSGRADFYVSLGYISWMNGQKQAARRLFDGTRKRLDAEMKKGNEWSLFPYLNCRMNAIEGNKPEAYKWLQKAIDAGWRDYRWGWIDPLLENLRGDAQFKQIIEEVKQRVDVERKKVESL